MPLSRDEFVKALGDANLLTPEQLDAVRRDFGADPDARMVARRAVQRGWLTTWQAQQLLAGRTKLFLGKYKLLESLGQGGMGAVFKAEQPNLRRIVAVKVMARQVLSNKDAVSRFLREIRTAAALNHPNIVSAYDADAAGQTYFLVMEYVPGVDLKKWIARQGRLPIGWSCEVVRQAAVGLQHAFENGLVHRDIKPANLLIVSPAEETDAAGAGTTVRSNADIGSVGHDHAGGIPRVKILDLGLARFASDSHADGSLTQTGQIMGTPDYIAPEQAENTKRADIRADIYSLGCTLFEMLTGQVPFQGESAMQKVLARMKSDAPRVRSLRPDVPAMLDEIVARMLARDPALRPQVPGDVVRQLEPFALATSPQTSQETMLLEPELPSPPAVPPAAPVDAKPDTTLNGFLNALASKAAETPVAMRSGPTARVRRAQRPTPLYIAAAVSVVLLLIGAIGWGLGRRNTELRGDASSASNGHASPNDDPAVQAPSANEEPPPAIAPFRAAQAKAHQEAWAKHLGVPVEYTNSIGMKFRLIPPGEYLRGCTQAEIEDAAKFGENWRQLLVSHETPRHKVVLTRPLYLGTCEVTRKQFETVMGANPGQPVTGESHPMQMVRWNDAAEFCARLSRREKRKPFYEREGETTAFVDGDGYRLPTEAEWEFACRAGTTTRFWFGDTDADAAGVAWIGSNSGGADGPWRAHPVGEVTANPLGLFDMHGNVWEWCQDWFDTSEYTRYADRPAVDPQGARSGTQRVCRGGSYGSLAVNARSASRDGLGPGIGEAGTGFRVALAVRKNAASPPAAVAPFDAAQAKAHQEAWAKYLGVPVEYTNSIGMKLRLIPPGKYLRGSTPTEIEAAKSAGDQQFRESFDNEGPQHTVILTRPIYLGAHEVTQRDYEGVMGGNPSASVSPELPVGAVRWNDAAEFCARLSRREKRKALYEVEDGTVRLVNGGDGYRLPTEAEWEFACRAGTITRFWIGDSDTALVSVAWVGANTESTRAVGQLKANPFGLFDVHGNVWEWCQDWFGPSEYAHYAKEPAVDPQGPPAGTLRMIRGGAFASRPVYARSAYRDKLSPEAPLGSIGFRVVLIPR